MKQISVTLTLCFALFLAACGPGWISTSVPSRTPAARDDLPVFPGAEELKDDTASIHYYEISGADVFDVQRFYKKEMPNVGWEFLGCGDLSGDDLGEAYALWFARDEDIVTVEIYPGDHTVNVLIHFE